MTTKICSKCGEAKPITLFNLKRDKSKPHSLYRADCKDCQEIDNRKWRQSPAGKLSMAKKKADGRARAAYLKYKNSEKGKVWMKNGRVRRTQTGRGMAYDAVKYAVKIGKLSRKNSCSVCLKSGPTDFHHHKGYNKENRLNVVEICRQCHGLEHKNATL